ncbi:MAG: hypothetical protein ACRDQ5_00210 [Sciscionella sp.]
MDDPPSPRALADAALGCPAPHGANRLANWVGDGKPVTAKGVLRRKDVPAAGCALGIEVPALHRPWTAALITGPLVEAEGRAMAGQALAGWPPVDEEAVLDHWLQALAGSLISSATSKAFLTSTPRSKPGPELSARYCARRTPPFRLPSTPSRITSTRHC